MSTDYFSDFALQLKSFREAQGVSLQSIAIVTRLNQDYLKRLESGDLSFASDVYVRGYLRKYASQVGLDPEAIVNEFDSILRKIDFVHRDDHAPAPPDILGESGSEEDGLETNLAEELPASGLDQAVRAKLGKERKMHSLVSWMATGLILMALVQMILTAGERPASKHDEGAGEETTARSAVIAAGGSAVRPKLVLSAPIVPPQEKLLREASEERLLQEQREIERNLQNDEWTGEGPVPRISVQEAARDLEIMIRQ